MVSATLHAARPCARPKTPKNSSEEKNKTGNGIDK